MERVAKDCPAWRRCGEYSRSLQGGVQRVSTAGTGRHCTYLELAAVGGYSWIAVALFLRLQPTHRCNRLPILQQLQ